MGLRIRDAARSDLERLEELEQQCFSVPWTREQVESQLPDARHVFLAAEEDGRLLGYVGMMTVLDEGYISNVAVAPEARRRGIGRALAGRYASEARIRGRRPYYGYALSRGSAALARSMGFGEIHGETVSLYAAD